MTVRSAQDIARDNYSQYRRGVIAGPVAAPNSFGSAQTTSIDGIVSDSILTATATLDFASLAANTSAELTITVAGAVVGNPAIAVPPVTLVTGLAFDAYVSAANTVKVRLSNVTVAAIDPASASWKVIVDQR